MRSRKVLGAVSAGLVMVLAWLLLGPGAAHAATKRPVLRLGSSGPAVRDVEARLVQLRLLPVREVDGFYRAATVAAVKTYQRRALVRVTGAVDSFTLLNLRFDTRVPRAAELNPPATVRAPSFLDRRCRTGRVMCVDKSTRKLAWVVNGKVRRMLQVRFGSQFTPTREGSFRVYRKSANHVSSLFNTPMPYAMFFSGGQAVHYSPDFARVGYAGASHGCVNTRDKRAVAALFREVRLGDRVIVHR